MKVVEEQQLWLNKRPLIDTITPPFSRAIRMDMKETLCINLLIDRFFLDESE